MGHTYTVTVTKSGIKWVDLYDGDTKMGLFDLPPLTSFLSLRPIVLEKVPETPQKLSKRDQAKLSKKKRKAKS
jgi:hypothetical protein